MRKTHFVFLFLIIFSLTLFFPNSSFAQVPDVGPSGCVPAPGYPCDLPVGGGGAGPTDSDIDMVIGSFAVIVIIGSAVFLIKKAVGRKSESSYDTPSYSAPDGAVRISGDTPKMFEKPKTPSRPMTEVPSPTILPDPPKSPMDVAEELSKKWQTFTESELAKYFEDVGNCIIKNDASLHTEKAMRQKFRKILTDKGSKGVLDYSDTEIVHASTIEELARTLASNLAQTYAKDIGEKAIKAFGKPFSPVGILTFLISNFGTEITTPYICMMVHLRDR